MNLRDMRYLVAVADLKNFSQAAELCNVSQPTLSGQIKKLEEWLDIKIFERTNKRVMLTEVGELIVQSAQRIVQEADNIEEAAQSAHDPLSGKFRIGAFPTVATYIFPDLVPKIKAAMSKIHLILVEEKTATLIEKVKKGELDAAFLALPVEDNYLESVLLFEDEFMLAVPSDHELAKEKQVDLHKLHKYHVLLLEEGHCLRAQALEVCQLYNAEEQDFKATGLETLRLMVKAGTGITFMPKIAIKGQEEGICYIPFEDPAPRREIGLVWRKTTARKEAIRILADLMKRS